MKTRSTHATVAAMIRADLKHEFPGVTFRVHSECFSGGNSVHIDWMDGPKTETVDRLLSKYRAGHFDGMIDCYIDRPGRSYETTVKYVQCQRRYSAAAYERAARKIQSLYDTAPIVLTPTPSSSDRAYVEPNNDFYVPRGNGYASNLVYQEAYKHAYPVKEIA